MIIKNLFPDLPVARYNVAVWRKISGNIVLVGREVKGPGGPGEPDIGKLILVELDSEDNIVNERTIWEPIYDALYLEDPRALVIDSKDLIIGLTAVMHTPRGFKPFPSIVKISNFEKWQDVLPPVTLIQNFGPGKNITPVVKDCFLFRPEIKEYYHKLLLFEFKDLVPKKKQDIKLPENLPWAKWRIGTAMPPVAIDNNNFLLIIHGITIKDRKYVYSLGRAILTKNKKGYSIDVCDKPILTPDNFKDETGSPLVDQLRPEERSVVYSCGGIIRKSGGERLVLYVNVGDRSTFEVHFPLNDLTKGF